MTTRKVLTYPENKEALRKKSEAVNNLNQHVQRLIRDLKDTLQAFPDGVGLSAPQINILKRVVIVCIGQELNGQWTAGPTTALINPVILSAEALRKDFDGCLSFPGLYGETVRPHNLRVAGLNENGKPFNVLYEGFNAVLVHHEIDHLDGVLFIDRIDSLSDLYTIHENEHGEMIRTPVTQV